MLVPSLCCIMAQFGDESLFRWKQRERVHLHWMKHMRPETQSQVYRTSPITVAEVQAFGTNYNGPSSSDMTARNQHAYRCKMVRTRDAWCRFARKLMAPTATHKFSRKLVAPTARKLGADLQERFVVPPTKRLKPSWRPPAQWPPLLAAVWDNDIHAVQVLLQDPNTVRQIDNGPIGDDRNALYHAVQYHHIDIIKTLLQAKADPFKRICHH